MHSLCLRTLPLFAVPMALVVLAPRPSTTVLWDSSDPTAAVVGVVAVLAWACLGWLLLVAALSAVADLRVRGLSWLARLLVTRLAPASVRAAVALVVGGTLVAGTVAPAWANARTIAPVVPAPVTPLDWPRESSAPAPLGQPSATPTPTAAPAIQPSAAASVEPGVAHREVVAQDHSRPAVTQTVVVRPGDSLWSIARRSLPGTPTARQTAETWPLWWHTNRQVIGDNPHLIRPGTPLTAPT